MTMKRIMYFAMVVIMMLASASCSKHDDKDIDLPPTPPEEEEVPTINPIMTDFDDINQLYGTWTADKVMLSGDWYELTFPRVIVFNKDGTFSYTDEASSFKGTFFYSDSTAICTRNDILPVIADRYRFKFLPYNDSHIRIEMTEVGFGVNLVLDFIASKTAEEQETQE